MHHSWLGENCWINPPFNLVGPVVRRLVDTGAQGTLIAPVWDGQAWWAAAVEGCTSYEILPPHEGVFTHGSRCTPAPPPKWSVAAFRFAGGAPACRG